METQNGGFLSLLFNSSMFRFVMSRPDAVTLLADVTTDPVAVASNALQQITEAPEAVGSVDSVLETATMATSGPGRGVRNVFTYVTSPWAVLCLFMVSVLESPRLLFPFLLAFPRPVCFFVIWATSNVVPFEGFLLYTPRFGILAQIWFVCGSNSP